MPDYVPHRSEQLVSWFANFVEGLTENADVLGVDPADIAQLDAACSRLDAALVEQLTARCAAKAATAEKNARHNESDDLIRAMVRRITGNPAMTDAIRCQLGLHVPDLTRTPANTEAGNEVPRIDVEALPGNVIVHFGTSPSSEHRNSKPSWAAGCIIYRKKSGESEFRMVGFQTVSPYVDPITGPAADYTYIVRYQGKTAADAGVFSSPATVAASGLLAA